MIKLTSMGTLRVALAITALFAFLVLPAMAMARPKSGGSFGGRGGFRAPSSSYSRAPSPSTRPGGPNVVIFPGFGWGFMPFGGAGGSLLGTLMVAGVLGLGAVMVVRAIRRSQRAHGPAHDEHWDDEDAGVAPGRCHVYKVQLGLGRSARGLQDRLARFAAEGDTSSEHGMSALLQQTALELMREKASIRYASAEGHGPMSLTNGETKLNALSLAERSRFQVERVRGADGRVRRDQAASTTSQDVLEYIVVTLVIATRTPLTLGPVTDRENLEAFLSDLGGVAAQGLLGMEVVWTPADPEDALTKDDLVTTYPELRNL